MFYGNKCWGKEADQDKPLKAIPAGPERHSVFGNKSVQNRHVSCHKRARHEVNEQPNEQLQTFLQTAPQ
jgi:hypothetical protein